MNPLCVNSPPDQTPKTFSNPDNYLQHFFKRPVEAIDFLEHIVRNSDVSSELVFNSLLENYLQSYSRAANQQEQWITFEIAAF